jgi:transposase
MDKLNKRYKTQVEQITYEYTCQTLSGKPGIVFYDVTTLYFEASNEDDFRKTGFSKDGKHRNPQIVLGCLVGYGGYPIGYEIFEGGMYEGYTLEPVLNNFEQRFGLNKPIVVADAGMLSDDNIKMLESNGYKYILGARIKNETKSIKQKILDLHLDDGEWSEIAKPQDRRLIITYSTKRAKKDKYNRERGLKRLEKRLNSGKLTKNQLNNRGYNKYLIINGDVSIEIDYEKFKADYQWDGLKGYITNADLPADIIIDNYKNLWHIEKAFRISKTDLRIRPIYHRLIDRIEAHLCVAFSAYAIYKELERTLKLNKVQFSAKRAIELTQTMYRLDFVLPASKLSKSVMIGLSSDQQLLYDIFSR